MARMIKSVTSVLRSCYNNSQKCGGIQQRIEGREERIKKRHEEVDELAKECSQLKNLIEVKKKEKNEAEVEKASQIKSRIEFEITNLTGEIHKLSRQNAIDHKEWIECCRQ